jgi:hypothetical protein
MAPRRKNHALVAPPADDAVVAIQEEIDRLDQEERQLELELLDPLTDLETPVASDDEGEDHPPPHELKDQFLATVALPTRPTNYSSLYMDPSYRGRAERKVREAKKVVRKVVDFATAVSDDRYVIHVNRVRDTYPDNGGRTHLRELIALVCLIEDGRANEDSSGTDENDSNSNSGRE